MGEYLKHYGVKGMKWGKHRVSSDKSDFNGENPFKNPKTGSGITLVKNKRTGQNMIAVYGPTNDVRDYGSYKHPKIYDTPDVAIKKMFGRTLKQALRFTSDGRKKMQVALALRKKKNASESGTLNRPLARKKKVTGNSTGTAVKGESVSNVMAGSRDLGYILRKKR